MADNVTNEILKSHIFGMSIEDISECYEISVGEIKEIIAENTDEIEELKRYYEAMKG